MNVAICVLANNMYLFKELIINLPDNLKDFKFFVFNDTRIGNKTSEIHEIMKDFNYEVITDKDTNELLPVKTNFVLDYSMSLKMLMPWYLFSTKEVDKVLFSDEDVLYTDKLFNVLNDINVCSFTRLGLQAASDKVLKPNLSKNYISLIKICECFEYKYDAEEWYKKRISSGQHILMKNQFNLKEYEKGLINFFKNEQLLLIWKNRRTHTSYFIDERVLTAFIIKTNIRNAELEKHTYFCVTKESKLADNVIINNYRKKAIFHICNTSHKKKTYARMIKLGLIKGELPEI